MFNRLEERFIPRDELTRTYPWTTSLGAAGPPGEGNVYTSLIVDKFDKHFILLDLDAIPVALVPSSTPGHNHLYIWHEVTTEQLNKLVNVLNEIGILQDGIVRGWMERGKLYLRKPGIMKGVEV